jgi:ABC-2 type transport system permease protein
MNGILAIYRREMKSYFVSPIAYVVIGFFLIITGYFFANILGILMERSMMAQMQAQRFGGPQEMDVVGLLIRNFVGVIATVLLFLVPVLTMGVYSEERKRGTMEMLMTSPVTELQIVLGKYFASLSLFCLMLAPTSIYHIAIARFSEPALPWRIVGTGYLGIFLLGAVLIAIGSFISSLTESQIISSFVTFAVFLILWVLDFGVRGATTPTGEVLKYLSILQHYDSFAQGVIDTTSLVFYLSTSIFALFLTLRTLESMRWRRA